MINRYASLRQGLVGAWCPSLGASGFRLIDRSGNNNHGTLTNMDPGTDWVPSGGKLALDFDGVNDYCDIPDSEVLSANKQITVAFWAYVNTLPAASNGNRMWAVTKGNTSNFEHQISINAFSGDYGKWSCVYYDLTGSNFVARSSSSNAVAGVWQHVTWTANRNGSVPDIYLNGILSNGNSTVNGTTSVGDGSAPLQIGRRATGGDVTFNGSLDDIRIYNRVLTPNEIRLLYTGGRGVGLMPERIKHRRKTSAAATNRRRRIICGANC